ncbi:hypothetical protein IJ843_00010 [bacterium]|nr:hypothetical protein [bacterium]
MEADIEEKLFDIQSKFNLLHYALGYMHLQNIEDCTDAYVFSETIKKDFDDLIGEF